MARRLEPFEPTWLDRHFRKAFDRLDARRKAAIEKELGDLLVALQTCTHPINDPNLRPWKPKPYRITLRNPQSKLAEYSLTAKSRVIVRYLLDTSGAIGDELLLIAATVDHDHDRLTALIKTYKTEL